MPNPLTSGARRLRRAPLTVLTRLVGLPYWRPLVRDVAIVFMLHRFADPERGVDGTSVATLRASLAFLRRHRFRLGSFQDLVRDADDACDHRGAMPSVLFTVDDGYAEFASVAAPVFAEFDCPVTVFLTTGPLDRHSWFWWDQVEYAVRSTTQTSVHLDLERQSFDWSWEATRRGLVAARITEQLKVVPNQEKVAAVAALAELLEVVVPTVPPPRYESLTWTDVRQCAARGAAFAPHTVTHPMLPRISEAEAEWEITESWRRLQAECDAAIPVFSYPNGAFSDRDVAILARAGMIAGVTTRPYYASFKVLHPCSAEARFRIPRFNFPTDHTEFVSIVTGLDRLHSLVREGRSGWKTVGGDLVESDAVHDHTPHIATNGRV